MTVRKRITGTPSSDIPVTAGFKFQLQKEVDADIVTIEPEQDPECVDLPVAPTANTTQIIVAENTCTGEYQLPDDMLITVSTNGCVSDSDLINWQWVFNGVDSDAFVITDHGHSLSITASTSNNCTKNLTGLGFISVFYEYTDFISDPVVINFVDGGTLLTRDPFDNPQAPIVVINEGGSGTPTAPVFATTQNSGNNRYHLPAGFFVSIKAQGQFSDDSQIVWHYKYNGGTDGATPVPIIALESGGIISFNAAYEPTLLQTMDTLGVLDVWYEYAPACISESDHVTITFTDGGNPLYSVGACGMADDILLDPPDIGFTVKTRQYVQNTTTGNYVPNEDWGELFIADARAVGRVIEWHWQYAGHAQDVIPSGLFIVKYGLTKSMNGGALFVGQNQSAACGLAELPNLGVLDVWFVLDGVESAHATLEFISAGSIAC